METVVVQISARPGMEDKVEAFYLGQQAEYEAAPGFIDRRILKAKTGAMFEAIKSRRPRSKSPGTPLLKPRANRALTSS